MGAIGYWLEGRSAMTCLWLILISAFTPNGQELFYSFAMCEVWVHGWTTWLCSVLPKIWGPQWFAYRRRISLLRRSPPFLQNCTAISSTPDTLRMLGESIFKSPHDIQFSCLQHTLDSLDCYIFMRCVLEGLHCVLINLYIPSSFSIEVLKMAASFLAGHPVSSSW